MKMLLLPLLVCLSMTASAQEKTTPVQTKKAIGPKQDDPKAIGPKQDDPKAIGPKQDDPRTIIVQGGKTATVGATDTKAIGPKQDDPKAAIKRMKLNLL